MIGRSSDYGMVSDFDLCVFMCEGTIGLPDTTSSHRGYELVSPTHGYNKGHLGGRFVPKKFELSTQGDKHGTQMIWFFGQKRTTQACAEGQTCDTTASQRPGVGVTHAWT
jgi:hypothetical protein